MRSAYRLLFLGCGILSLATQVAPAVANPMEDTSLGGAVFTGPTSGHASSFFVNPAALGLSGSGTHFHLGGSAQLSSLYITRERLGVDGSQASGESLSTHTLSPGGIIAYYSSFFDNSARVGLALSSPTTQRFPSGERPLGYQSLGGHVTQDMLTVAVTYLIANIVHVGFGISLGYSSMRLKYYRDTAPSQGSGTQGGLTSDCAGSPCGFENPQARETYDIKVGDRTTAAGLLSLKNASISLGAVYRLPDDSLLGFGYVALPGSSGSLSLPGTADITLSPRDGGGQEQSLAEVGFRMAQTLYLGYRRTAFGSVDLATDLRWQDWSRHDQLDVRIFGGGLNKGVPAWMPRYRGLRDVWRVSVGLESNDQVRNRFGARLRFETRNAAKDASTPLLVANESVTLATGAEMHLADQWVLGIGYEIGWTPATKITNSDFDPRDAVRCADAERDYDTCQAARQGRDFATAAGRYLELRHGLLLSLRYDSL